MQITTLIQSSEKFPYIKSSKIRSNWREKSPTKLSSTLENNFLLFYSACIPRLILLRIAVILCCLAILLCMLLMAYDIIVLIDPTRCFFLNCNDATVTLNSTTVISGWPIYVTWPDYFQTNMTAKRIFQSIQILCAGLFILFAALFLLTYFIYRHIRLHQQTIYRTDEGTFTTYEKRPRTAMKYSNNNNNSSVMSSYSQPMASNHKVTTYVVTGPSNYFPTQGDTSPRRTKTKTFVRPRANSLDTDRLCTRCNREPKMIITTNYERQNYFPNLCINCNNDLANARRRPTLNQSKLNRVWRH